MSKRALAQAQAARMAEAMYWRRERQLHPREYATARDIAAVSARGMEELYPWVLRVGVREARLAHGLPVWPEAKPAPAPRRKGASGWSADQVVVVLPGKAPSRR